MNWQRTAVALTAATCYGFVALLALEFLAAALAALIVMVTGDYRDEPGWRTGAVTLLGAVAVFTVTFWRVYHAAEPNDPPPSQP